LARRNRHPNRHRQNGEATVRAKGKTCFECTAVDGRVVRLFKERYYGHILREHPELSRDFPYPAGEIERALKEAVRTYQGQGRNKVYVGPNVEAKSDAGTLRVRVVVNVEEIEGWVVTAYAEIVL
jgi:hypothetical protein